MKTLITNGKIELIYTKEHCLFSILLSKKERK